MTLIFNSDKYKELLSQYQPKIIRNEADNEKALVVVEELMHRRDRTPEEDELYELLIALIEKFEQEYYAPGATATRRSLLLFLMEQRSLKPADLVGIIGSEEGVYQLVNGEGYFSKEQALILGSLFHVEPSLFTN
ncbi:MULTISPECIES: transcriptional regulator [unclassified Microcoleus]|uniref:helix-turn-helix domain-containing protein n=1 Tax=unclassified Microcoleus TaxID=2642155 RepID=UPI001E0F4ADF|nr:MULTISPECIES: transcriptional regulator [unclassified Microcoleus]MCC3507127.1 transcriptional regulator [Microcoleus sp. PH2017_19_SFW_U_A]TAG89747.1 MAG: transcriptional regulator [Oscillatoriales cyanobacterium]MCC3472466.1 transcriptional regulator [Microcoleus sp. PH2017_13_LAR_U_A]MCC3485033.1 transcriptional regulator [Microcoleus sp. PH2017_14_LAR_D_A]MCC3497107.1 transcriptional regulator [Microcoleus sp. PH2017_15_JOR_U_A]